MANRKLIKQLDIVFKLYIRMRDLPNGYGVCCSCNKFLLFSQSDGGHFINCGKMPTRWDETNVHAQCRACNRFSEGNGPGYTLFMVDRYGRDHVEYLIEKSKSYAGHIDYELQQMIKDYKQKIKDIGYVKL